MKDPETGTEQQSREKMAIVTSIERMIFRDKVCLDLETLSSFYTKL